MEVVKVKSGDSFAIINRTDYNPDEHELYEGESVGGKSDAQKLADELEVRRQLEANRGVIHGGGLRESDRNTSGTFSEPTPTDIRFPDKNATEFENNHQALIGRAAPEARAKAGIEDAPGGIKPAVAARVLNAPAPGGQGAQRTEHQPDLEAAADAAEGGDAVIPDDWADLPWREQVKLAGTISGNDKDMTAAEAREFLGAEVERRKAV